MKIIGLAGKARSGKDTTADIISAHEWIWRDAFAAPIRAIARATFDMTDEELEKHKEKIDPIIGMSPRQFMQRIGDAGRSIDPAIWIKSLELRLSPASSGPSAAVITDVRFENEATWIRNQGGEIWHIQRENAGTRHEHSSENGIDIKPGDIVIENNGTTADLATKVANSLYQ